MRKLALKHAVFNNNILDFSLQNKKNRTHQMSADHMCFANRLCLQDVNPWNQPMEANHRQN